TIENRDALISWDKKILERDEHGKPLTRWDGETMKLHPVTGKKVPDEDARVEVERYVGAKAAKWPKADFIVGNPPFIGGKDVRERLGGGYFDALFKTTDVPESADFVMHWWDKAALATRKKTVRRFGFITTNSLPQTFSRRVVAKYLENKDRISLTFAIPNHPWVDSSDGAAVRIAMTVSQPGKAEGLLRTVTDESAAPDSISLDSKQGMINSDLRIGADVTAAVPLKSHDKLASPGVKLHGSGFILSPEEAEKLGFTLSKDAPRFRSGNPGDANVIFDYRNGRDLASRSRDVKIIDLYGLTEAEARDQHPAVYQHVLSNVKPHRAQNNRASYRENWWIYGEARSELRKAMAGIDRYIATIETAKHRVFQFLPIGIVPDNMLVCSALSDAFWLGVMSSRLHVVWALRAGGTLEDRPRYNKTACFDPFPFPAEVPDNLKDCIRNEAEKLDALRKKVLAEHSDITLTGLYNALEAIRVAEQEKTAIELKLKDIATRGQVSLIKQHHDAIDAAVAEAYGWPAGLSDDEILTRLVALNRERAAEEAKGVVRWLRPEYQSPGETAKPVNRDLDLGDAPALPVVATIIPWPKTLAEQVSAVANILAASPLPQHPRDIARAIKGTNAKG
ncbi:MAG: DNA methyltransferase, partial [Pontixanthobacter sp.]